MRCKKCGTDNPDSASYCRNCGFELSAIRKSKVSSAESDADKTVSFGETPAPSSACEPGKAAAFRKAREFGDDRGGYKAGGGNGYSDVNPPSADVPAGYSAEPLSMWAYMGLSVLFGIPMAGFICLIVFSCGAVKNINLVNYARGLLLIEIIVMVLGFLLMYTYGLTIANLVNSVVSSY